MNTPVNFEIAKLLKDKRFDKFCENRYNKLGELTATKLGMNMQPNNYSDSYSAPTIADIVMWLYEKHGIWIWVEKYENEPQFVPQIPKANLQKVLGFFNSPTEAYSVAIEYCLTNLIKENEK